VSSLQIRESAEGCTFTVRVHPGAKRDAIVGVHNGELKVSLTATPSDGEANRSLIKFLSVHLHTWPGNLKILSGAKSRTKVLEVTELSVADLLTRLALPSEG